MSRDSSASVNASGGDSRPRIVPAGPADWAELLELSHVCDPHPWSEESLRSELCGEFPFHFLLRSFSDNRLVSAVLNRLVFDELTVMKVYTRPAWRRRGLARLLLAHTLHEAECRGAKTAFLEVEAGNTPAIGLYESLGFARLSIRPGYYPCGDAVVMKRELGSNQPRGSNPPGLPDLGR